MNNANKKKTLAIVALIVASLLLICGSVAATVAYFTDTKTVENTFTIGKVAITLDEGTYSNGVFDAQTRTTEGNTYVLVPGDTYDKDPTVTVDADSVDAYIFVKVVNGLATVEDAENTIASQIAENNWTALPDVEGVYYAEFDGTATVYPVFTTLTIDADADFEALTALENKTISVTAFAIQKDATEDVADAWSILSAKYAD